MSDPTKELIFQNEVVAEMMEGGWKRGNPENYDPALALYPEDVIGFVKDTQPEPWEKFCGLYPANPEHKLLERVAEQLNKAAPNAADRAIKQYKSTRLPVDPVTKKPEPLLTFKRGALVHFTVSQ
jgi:type I restriction enzyme R subunit